MVSFFKLLIAVIAVASVHVSATRFCRCVNKSKGGIYPGIQEVCNKAKLGDKWCATKCYIGGWNCDYCQYKPKGGYTTDPEWQSHKGELDSWCNRQGNPVHKKEIECYVYSQVGNCFWGICNGCSYENNGD
jgi:hypothetical protein